MKTRSAFPVGIFCAFLFSCWVVIGCASGEKPSPMAEAKNEESATSLDLSRSVIANITFVGQKKACECTRKRIDAGWSVLDSVTKGVANIKVKKIQLDVDEKEADMLDETQTLIVAPGIYFFDEAGKLVKMLQGEVGRDQILGVLLQGEK